MTFQINASGTEVILAETGDANSTLEDFCGIFEENQCKYGGIYLTLFAFFTSFHP